MPVSRHDVRLAARSFIRHPGFTTTAVLSLALAIALNTTMYSVIDALVNPKVEMQDPDRLYHIVMWGDTHHRVDAATSASLLREGGDTYESSTFSQSSGMGGVAVEHDKRFEQTNAQFVPTNYFRVLGVRPLAGRLFLDEDFTASSQPVVITERLAGVLFAEGKSPIAKTLDVDGVWHPIIGVISNNSQFPGEHVDVWMPFPPGTQLSAIAFNLVRLRKGVSAELADQRLHVLSTRFASLAGELPKDAWFQLVPASVPQFHYRGFHIALIAAVVAVLLIACANLANLQLARGIGRSRELALRTALGATRRDIILQLVLESALLGGAGLVAGLLLTFWGVHLLASRIPPSVAEYVIAPQTSWRVLAFAMTACVFCVMFVGLLPAIRVSRVDPNELLKSGAGTGANKKSRQQYGVMVMVEIALSLALLSGAGIVVRSALHVKSAFKTDYDLTPLSAAWVMAIPPRDTAVLAAEVFGQLVTRIRALPDVAEATVYGGGIVNKDTVSVYGPDNAPRQIAVPLFSYKMVTPSYLRTFQLTVSKGRDFIEGMPSESEVIVDQETANVLWPGVDPIGKQVKFAPVGDNSPWVRVVGVVRQQSKMGTGFNATYQTLLGQTAKAARLGTIYYLPSTRDTLHLRGNRNQAFFLAVRSKLEPDRMPITLKTNAKNFAPYRLLFAERMDVFLGIRRERESHNFVAATFVSFAALALALAALGIYGIVAHSVAERRRELGVRIALGATPRNILQAVLREGNALALAGLAVGLILTRLTVDWLAAFSLEDAKYDAPLFAAMGALLFGVAVLSALIPGLRATRIDPVEALRSE
ncbi:MAG: FtsX-like permease family protein [Gemmatimonadaceae bacterium]